MNKYGYSERRECHYSPESLKLAVVREYESTNVSKAYLKCKYGVSGISLINYWLKRYAKNADLPSKITVMEPKPSEDTPEVPKLKKRIRQLERELEDEKLLSEAYYQHFWNE